MRPPALPITLLVLALGAVASTGAGAEGETTAAANTVVERVTVASDATATEAAQTTTEDTTDAASSDDDESSAAASGDESSSSGSEDRADASGSACVEVPEVVGLPDLQLSQDTLQATGFSFMGQDDATGQGRAQLLDRN